MDTIMTSARMHPALSCTIVSYYRAVPSCTVYSEDRVPAATLEKVVWIQDQIYSSQLGVGSVLGTGAARTT